MRLRFCLPVVFAAAAAAVFLACGGGGKNNAPAEPISVSVSPKTVNLKPSAQQTFVATVSGSNDKRVTWSAISGTVNSVGNYTAPTAAGTYYVTATSAADPTKSDAAAVTVDPPGSLSYQDPSGTGHDFRFVRNAALSTPTHLVLDLVASTKNDRAAGLAFTLSFGATNAVSWAKVGQSDSMMVQNGTVFSLGSSPIGLKTTVESSQIKAVVAQKGLSNAPALNTGTLARVALDANPGAQPEAIPLSATKFQILNSSGTITVVSPGSVAFGVLSLL